MGLLAICLTLLLACGGAAKSNEDWIWVPESAIAEVCTIEDGVVGVGETLQVPVQVPRTGEYHVMVSYLPMETSTLSNTALIHIDGNEVRSRLPVLWRDVPGEVQYDRYGNEILPDQEIFPGDSLTYLQDYSTFAGRPYVFVLPAGQHTITLKPESFAVQFTRLVLIHTTPQVSYRQYHEETGDLPLGKDFVIIEAEDYVLKNDSFIRGTSVKNTAVRPNDPCIRRINALAHTSFKNPGQKVLYEFAIATPGLYALAFSYSQPTKPGMPVFRTIELDGQVLFEELRDVPFSHTGMNVYDHLLVGAAETCYIYLDQGRHTLALQVTAAPLDEIYIGLSEMITEMNAVTLKIKKLTGQNSDVTSNIDTNRTWDVLQYMPTILDDISRWQRDLHDMHDALRTISGTEPTFANDLMLAAQNLERLKEEPRTLPRKIALLGDDASSAAQLLGTLLPKLAGQELSIDRIYVYDGQTILPEARETLRGKVRTGLKEFLHSFSPVMNESARRGTDVLTVWVNKSSQYVEVLQELTAQDFTPRSGINVNFSIMPREDKLILSNASGTNPDVVVGLSAHYPFDFGVRGTAQNLLEWEDFLDWYGAEYNLESLVPFSFDGGVYAAADTNEFRVLFYRRDILAMLGLDVPQTMDDVRGMMPTLHRNGMNFSIPLSTDREGFKGFQQTMPFVYQRGGDVYAADGLSASLNDPRTIQGLQDMVNLYTIYGLQSNVRSFFNSFRSGVIPIGISSYETYLQLQTTALELADLWDIALAPGEADENGTILRYQAAVDTSTMILANTTMPNEAYAFMKWWLSSDTQVKYANRLQLKYGPDYKWNTANLVAFEQMGFPEKHKDVILTMWREWQRETPRHLASYMLEREISNLWGYVVRDNKPFMPALDVAQKNTNREMRRKLQEFGFIEEGGTVLRSYQVPTGGKEDQQ